MTNKADPYLSFKTTYDEDILINLMETLTTVEF